MPDDLPPLTEGILRAQFDPAVWQRGRPYVRDGSVRHLSRYGATLRALVSGSAPHPYRVEATLGPKGIIKAYCTCPVGSFGECKHVAATLQRWLDAPEKATEREPPALALQAMDKDALVALALRMLDKYPDLEAMLATPRAAEGPSGEATASRYRDRAADALGVGDGDDHDDEDDDGDDRYDDYYDGYGGPGGDSAALDTLVAEGDAFAAREEYRAATAAYIGIASAILDGYEEMPGFEYDESGEVLAVAGKCLDGLQACLPHETDPEHRAEIVETIYQIDGFDYGIPGQGAVWSFLAAQATPDEKRMLVGWLHDALGPHPDAISRHITGRHILALEGDTYDDTAYLRLCEAMGLTIERITRLVALGRNDEAIRALHDVEGADVLAAAQLLSGAGQADAAERFVQARANETNDLRLWEWLRDRLRERGDAGGAQRIAERVFRAAPTLPRYAAVRDLARERAMWESVRPEMLDAVRPLPHRDTHISILLDEGDHEGAVALTLTMMTPELRALPYGGGSYYRAVVVAETVTETHPDGAREIYAREAERLIAQKKREAYAEAARHLARVRDLFDRTDRFDDWLAYRDDLRQRYRTLRALREEMESAGLLD